MKLNQKLAHRLFLCLTPLVTGSVFVALPGFAATLASSQAEVNFSNFSHNPLTVETEKTPNPSQSTNDGQVATESKADAIFSIDRSNPSGTTASSTSVSTVEGNGNGYSGTAQSNARLAAYNFSVGAGETFSFNFTGLLDLKTSVDSDPEAADASGTIAFQLFDSNDLNNPLEFFTAWGNLTSLNNSDFLNVFNSSNVTLIPNQTTSTTSFGGNQESANTTFTGQFSRFFDRATNLVLRQFNSNSSGASCPAR